jgi:hypothetical protein
MADENKPVVHQMTDHPWVAVDLDGCLMEDNHYPAFGAPRVGAKAAMDYLKSLKLKIMIFTARTHISGLDGKFQNVNKIVNDIYAWGGINEIPIDYVWPMPKPASIICFFDDRAIRVEATDVGLPGFAWTAAINAFDHNYAEKIPNWLREVTPKSFAVTEK